MAKKVIIFEVIRGVEGPCLAVSDGKTGGFRIAGPKPWGGGKTIYTFKVDYKELLEKMAEYAQEDSRDG